MADLFDTADGSGTAENFNSAGGSSAAHYFHPGAHAPLAVRLRPKSVDEIVGQQHVLGEGRPLRRLMEGQGETSVILYGPPGTGKTTIASVISSASGRDFETLSALSSGVKDIRTSIERARKNLIHGQRTVLFIDEVHRFSKTQQDALLAAVENRVVLLVAATTENPSFCVVAPLLSRSLVVQLEPLSEDDIRTVLHRAIEDPRGYGGQLRLDADAEDHLVAICGGDARRSLTYLEAAAESRQEPGRVTLEDVESNVNKAAVRYDRAGDQHYDVTSALIKSIRGSDPDAAVHYLARMLEAGEDPRFIARRLVILASEDIGMADPTALQVAVAAHQAVSVVGMPEARLTLTQAVLHLATAPKSNAVIDAISAAMQDVHSGRVGVVPAHLRDGHYGGAKALGNAVGYRYPHDDPKGVVAQQYLPDALCDAVYYHPSDHGFERTIAARLEALRAITRTPDKRE